MEPSPTEQPKQDFDSQISEIRKAELAPAKDEKNPFEEKYTARKAYKALLTSLAEENDQTFILRRAKLNAFIARNHFDTDENTDARNHCKASLEEFGRVEKAELLCQEINSIVFCLNNLGFHSVLGERFYEGVYYLRAAEGAYWALKGSLGRNEVDMSYLYGEKSMDSGVGGAIKKDWARAIGKVFLAQAVIPEQMLAQIGQYIKTHILGKLQSDLSEILKLSNDPEQEIESSELTQLVLKKIPDFRRDPTLEIDRKKLVEIEPDYKGMDLRELEEHHIQTVFFLAQVFAKLMERDLSAENCGKTLQRQYFKLIYLKENRIEGEKLDFDYTDFTNNSMGLSMYYSEKMMFKQGLALLALSEAVLEGDSKAEQLLRGSVKHMRGNLYRDYFMHNALIIKDEGPDKIQSRLYL